MVKVGKIGEGEAIAFVVIGITTKIFLTYPAVLVYYAANAAWMVVIISGMVSLGFFWFMYKLVKRFPEQDFSQISERIMGPYLGLVIALSPLLGWFVEIAIILRSFSESMLIVALPETSLSIVMGTFLISASIVVYLGIKTIVRICFLTFPFLLLAILAMTLLSFSNWDSRWLFPLLGNGLLPIFKAGVMRSSDYLEIGVFYTLPLLFYSKQLKRIGVKSIATAGLVFLVVIVTYAMTFPSTVGMEPYLPVFMMTRSVFLGNFIQRIEIVFVLFWVFAGLIYLSTGFCILSIMLSQILRLPDHKPLILPLALVFFAIAFVPANLPDTVLFSNFVFREFGWMPLYGLPVLLYLTAVIRGVGGEKHVQKN